MFRRASLPTCVILGVMSLTSAAQAFDRTCTQRQDAQGQGSDHGMAVGERYDAQGNPVDRQGNVIAVPNGRSGSNREVFVQEPAFRR
jgi:microcystin degradation protein MlrC